MSSAGDLLHGSELRIRLFDRGHSTRNTGSPSKFDRPFAIRLYTIEDLQSSILFPTSHLIVQHTMRPSHRRGISSQCVIETQRVTEKDDLPSPLHSTDRPLSISTLLVLTCGAGALQMFWSTVMANLPVSNPLDNGDTSKLNLDSCSCMTWASPSPSFRSFWFLGLCQDVLWHPSQVL